ncbi:MAG: hypothetical protein ACREX9_23160 [Gammaproteobacteria bacterium]
MIDQSAQFTGAGDAPQQPDDFYSDPQAALARAKEELRAEFRAELAREGAVARQQAEEAATRKSAQSEYWRDFYHTHPHLKEHDAVVKGVFESHRPKWAADCAMTIEDSYSKLAGEVERKAARLAAQHNGAPEFNVDGETYATHSGQKGGATMSSAILKRQAQMRLR